MDQPGLTCAAVLVPLRLRDDGWRVVVTKRTETVDHHKGQISFPGGSCEAGDAHRLATALRETYEEIGIPPSAIDVLGALDDFTTVTGFGVAPFVGIIQGQVTYHPNAAEVSEVIEIPLSFLLDPSHLRMEELEHEGTVHEVLFWDYGPFTIWGATARILRNLLDTIT
jgi:8-oxo-dGTP pyrophosphatase MutT (NUDIX family)